MSRIVGGAFLLLVTGLLAIACSSTSLVFATDTCTSGGKTYQTCDQANGDVEYKFNGTSCTCSSSNQSGCTDCANKLSAYCQ